MQGMKEKATIDPRLQRVNLYDPEAVCEALGGESTFDIQAYLTLPQGKRLLTAAELELLDETTKRPYPEPTDPEFPMWDLVSMYEDFLHPNPWAYNWDPKKQKPVYPSDTQIPDGVTEAVSRIIGPKKQAQREERKKVINATLSEIHPPGELD